MSDRVLHGASPTINQYLLATYINVFSQLTYQRRSLRRNLRALKALVRINPGGQHLVKSGWDIINLDSFMKGYDGKIGE